MFYLKDLKEKGALFLYYIDLVTVGLLVQCLGKKYHWVIDHGPSIMILARSICVIFLHSSYQYKIGV